MSRKWSKLALGVALLTGFLGFTAGAEGSDIDGSVVLQVQQLLHQRGFDPGPRDGIMGPRTRQALVSFQAEMGLEANGKLNDATLKKLGLKEHGDEGVLGKIGAGFAAAGEAVAGATKTAAKATAKGAKVAATETAEAAETGAKATAKGATIAAETTAEAAETGAEATAGGVTVAAKATAKATKKGAKKTASGATEVAKESAEAIETGVEAVADATRTAAVETKEFLFGEEPALAARVRNRLQAHPRIDADQIDIKVEGQGTVRLVFKSGSHDDWERAVAVTRKVDGVNKVFVRFPETS